MPTNYDAITESASSEWRVHDVIQYVTIDQREPAKSTRQDATRPTVSCQGELCFCF